MKEDIWWLKQRCGLLAQSFTVTCFHFPSESTDAVFVPCKDEEMPNGFHMFCSSQMKDTKS